MSPVAPLITFTRIPMKHTAPELYKGIITDTSHGNHIFSPCNIANSTTASLWWRGLNITSILYRCSVAQNVILLDAVTKVWAPGGLSIHEDHSSRGPWAVSCILFSLLSALIDWRGSPDKYVIKSGCILNSWMHTHSLHLASWGGNCYVFWFVFRWI
jgi:hypothetical protein